MNTSGLPVSRGVADVREGSFDMPWRFLNPDSIGDQSDLYTAALSSLLRIEEKFTEGGNVDSLRSDMRDLARELRLAQERLA